MKFSLHGLFTFQIDGRDKRLIKYFEKDYASFRTSDESESEMVIIVGDFTPDNDNCYIIDHKYYVRKNYIFWKDQYKVVNWQISIENIEGKPIIHFKGGLFSELFLRENILEPLMAVKLAQKGISLLHASGIALNDQGVIFPAGKGVGKTSTILGLSLEKNSKFLGNEPVIISDAGLVYSFPSRIRLYHYNLKYIPQIYKMLTQREHFEFLLKHLLYIFSLKYACLGLEIDPYEIFEMVGDKHPLRALVLLTRSNRETGTVAIKENIDKQLLIDRLVFINRDEMLYFSRTMRAYSYIYPESEVALYWKTLADNLSKTLSSVNCHEIELPLEYTSKVYQGIFDFLKDKVSPR